MDYQTTTPIADADRGAFDEAMDAARTAYEEFQAAWGDVGRIVRDADEHMWNRVDAYPGWNGTRDVGSGQDTTGWMDEVQRWADNEEDAE